MSSVLDGPRQCVVVVTTHWGDSADEATTATRLIAGALARRANVEIVHIIAPPAEHTTFTDSVFTIHQIPHRGARPLRSGILRAALAEVHSGRNIPPPAAAILDRYEGDAPEVLDLISELAPDAVVLAGHHQPFDAGKLREIATANGARVIFFPFCSDHAQLTARTVNAMLTIADKIGSAHVGETRAILASTPQINANNIVALDLALPINRSATLQGLFGVRFFGSYMLLLRSFPPEGPRYENTATHEVLRSVLGKISVAEVDGDQWRISDRDNTLKLPVNPSRVNLWRLMAHARATIDVRPPGPIGREAIESMLLGTPVVAPEPSAGMSHIEEANGGLWYRDVGEMFDATRALMDVPLRNRLAAQARSYADVHHGQMDDFVERMAHLVLNEQPAKR